MASSQDIVRIGSYLISIGLVLVVAGFFLSTIQGGSGEFGGLVLIGPIPIAFGSSPEITTSMLYVGLLMFIIYLFIRRKM
ncbi:DUF131 domain-containing protein [Methanomethylovorans sp.]|uniref:TIGR00304 family membrane protein n=1 Tax=Methanomethylovorans sp. TaxID=2758717 RepID=UPI00351C0C43